ncbi:MAG TPA: PRC-barrel domain-containing protein [Chitinophagaceae bacterium]|nr:PRC-barrel domain-containing protein [Chitinophagaceae bacterium]
MSNTNQKRLQELDRSEYEIVKGEPDIRGWDVKYITGQKLGVVEELILDTQEKKVRYLIVDLEENELKLLPRKILIPIGLAELDRKDDDVLIPNIAREQLSRLPDYDRNHLTVDAERRISSTLGREMESTALAATANEVRNQNLKAAERKADKRAKGKKLIDERDPDFYTHEHYNLDNLYKNRLHEAERDKINESEYERGLRLWERRSEGGIIETGREEMDDATRAELLKNRRDLYRQRRYNEEKP